VADVDAATRQRLLDHQSKGFAERAAKVLAIDLNSNRAKLVAEYLPSVKGGGDVQLGSQLFKKMCSQCHKLGDVGHAVGPDLLSLTDKSPDALITAILDPNRAVETKFLTFTAVTRSGVSHVGLIATETAGSITLRGAEGKEVTLLRGEIEELQSSTKSLMPEGLERDLKPADAAALIAYIRLNVPLPALKKFAGNEPRVVSANDRGGFVLTPYDAEIYGPTIVIEEGHKNLGWWSSADDIVVWTIDVATPGTYELDLSYACEPSAAGNRIVVEAAGKTLTSKIQKTDSWDDYRSQPIGEIDLPAGQVRLTLKPASRPLPALADVKSLTVVLKK
jgi:putative heme-binding domain-containing protein